VPYVLVGAALLWVGWFGFNAGSAGSAGFGAGMAMLTTQIATASALVIWMGLEWMVSKKPTAVGAATGAVAGLVAITPAAGSTDVMGAIAIGSITSGVCYFCVTKLKHIFDYDDSLDVFGVHGVGGMLGSILLAFFAKPEIGDVAGIFYGSSSQLLPQIIGVIAVGVYTIVVSFIIFKIVDAIVGLRVSKDEEIEGLDETTHGERLMNEPIKF